MIFFIVSFLGCLLLSALLKRLLAKTKLSTVKERPMLLGLSLYLCIFAILICVLTYYNLSLSFIGKILIGSSLMLVLGIVDDIRGLSVNAKLLGQLAIAGVVVVLGMRTTIYYFPIWLNMVITIIWIVALVNAFNLLDIMDGLCTGVAFIMSVFFLLISLIIDGSSVTLFFWILSGATLGALIYNLPPAKLYLGDSGSMLLGFMFACSALNISYAPDFSEGLSLFIPVLIVALPIYDLTFTVFMRKKKGIAVAQKSRDHFVFIMKNLGFSTKKILAIMYGLCIFFGSSALLLKVLPSYLKILLLAIIIFVFAILTVVIGAIENRHSK